MIFSATLLWHIVSGVVALLVFSIPLAIKKGSKLHIKAGWIYLGAMVMVAISALALCSMRLLDSNSTQHQRNMAWFLIFISSLSLSSGWFGIRSLRFKKRSTRHTHWADLTPAGFLLATSIATAGYGAFQRDLFLIIFPLIGLRVGSGQLHYWLSSPTESMHWWFAHMAGMMTCCISTVTAFTVTAVPRLLSLEETPIYLWFTPAAVTVFLLQKWTKKYQRQFNQNSANQVSESP